MTRERSQRNVKAYLAPVNDFDVTTRPSSFDGSAHFNWTKFLFFFSNLLGRKTHDDAFGAAGLKKVQTKTTDGLRNGYPADYS